MRSQQVHSPGVAPACRGTNASGNPCGAPPIKGTDYCIAHSDDGVKQAAGFGGPQPGSGRRPNPRPADIARRLIEENQAVVLGPHFRTLGHSVEPGPDGQLVLTPLDSGGAKLHGTSKDGYVRLSDHDDLGAQMTASDRLMDRVYGKAKQATELSGPGGGPIEHAGAQDWDLDKLTDDELEKLEAILTKCQGEGHGARMARMGRRMDAPLYQARVWTELIKIGAVQFATDDERDAVGAAFKALGESTAVWSEGGRERRNELEVQLHREFAVMNPKLSRIGRIKLAQSAGVTTPEPLTDEEEALWREHVESMPPPPAEGAG